MNYINWIKCSDRMPEMLVDVLVCNSREVIRIAQYTMYDKNYLGEEMFIGYKTCFHLKHEWEGVATHWAKLNLPPKKEELTYGI